MDEHKTTGGASEISTGEVSPESAGSSVHANAAGPTAGGPPSAPEELSAKPVAGAGTPSGEPAQLEALRKKLEELEGRVANVPSDAEIAQRVLGDPRLKQSLRDMTAYQVKQQMDREIEARTAAIDELEEAGEIEPAVADKRRRAIARQVRQAYAALPRTGDHEGRPYADAEQGNAQATAEGALKRASLSWADFPSVKNVPLDQFLLMVAEKRAEKELAARQAEIKQAAIKEYEGENARIRAAEQQGATGAPPEGGGASNPLAKYGIEDTAELYRLARQKQKMG